jgi:hypothetical protein
MLLCVVQEKLNRIFDRGYIRRSDIEDYIMDEMESEWGSVAARVCEAQFADVPFSQG